MPLAVPATRKRNGWRVRPSARCMGPPTVCLEDDVLPRRGEPRGILQGIRGDAATSEGAGEPVTCRGAGRDDASARGWNAGSVGIV